MLAERDGLLGEQSGCGGCFRKTVSEVARKNNFKVSPEGFCLCVLGCGVVTVMETPHTELGNKDR